MPFVHNQTGIFSISVSPATGGTITQTTIGNVIYNVHTFTSNGNFVTGNTPLQIEYLLVGGGGGGAGGDAPYYCGGGGGSGAIVNTSDIVSNNSTYSIVIGTAGTGGDSVSTLPSNGGNSVAFGKTALGGGRGSQRTPSAPAASGGAGGGGYAVPSPGFNVGNVSVQSSTLGYGQGFDGSLGTEATGGVYRGGGGGGAASSGGDGGLINLGGSGFVSNITGANVTYAPGGVGGVAQPSTSFYNGGDTSTNFGSGGGGGTSQVGGGAGNNRTTGLSGTAGVVIVRYALQQVV